MREERRLTEWLADYRDSLDGMAAPSGVEARLRAEVRRNRRFPVTPWLAAAGVAAVMALGIWIGRAGSGPLPAPVVSPVVSAVVSAVDQSPAPLAELSVVEPAVPVERVGSGFARRVSTPRPVAAFVMLPGSELMPPTPNLQVLRVRIPRTRMQSLGWPVNVDRLEERVLAEVVVGDDGMARAVRLVRADQ